MCEFCKSGKRDIILNDDGSIICLTANAVVAIDRDTGKKHKNQIAINYCPICGRKLVEEWNIKKNGTLVTGVEKK